MMCIYMYICIIIYHTLRPHYTFTFFWAHRVARGCDLRHDGQRLHLRHGRQRQHGGMVTGGWKHVEAYPPVIIQKTIENGHL